MKKCPQCNTVYTDETAFCLNDGTALAEDSFALPSEASSDEPETVIRSEPIVIDIAGANNALPPPPPAAATNYPVMPTENVVVVPAVAPAAATRNYALFLILGLLIGGGLVLATLLLSKNLYQTENSNITVKTNSNDTAAVKVEKPKTPAPETQSKNDAVETASNKHSESNESFNGIANGRVIVLNARVRSAPDKDAPVVDVLPINDRLDIIRRENPNSPWYQVECEHGTNGWMHGDTIEFTK